MHPGKPWKNVSAGKKGAAHAWGVHLGPLTLLVQRCVDIPDTWFALCPAIGLDESFEATNSRAAAVEALQLVRQQLRRVEAACGRAQAAASPQEVADCL